VCSVSVCIGLSLLPGCVVRCDAVRLQSLAALGLTLWVSLGAQSMSILVPRSDTLSVWTL